MNIMMSNNMSINRATKNMVNNSTMCLGGYMCLSAMLGHDILALLHIGCVHHSLVLSAALLLLVALLLCMGGTLLLRHSLHHSVALRHRVGGTLLLVLSNIVGHMLGVAHSLRHSVALLAGHNLIGHMAPGCIVTISASIWVAISTTCTVPIVTPISWISICRGISRGLCFSRTQGKRKKAKKNCKLLHHYDLSNLPTLVHLSLQWYQELK